MLVVFLCFGEWSCFECAVPLTCAPTIKEYVQTYIAVKAQMCLLVHEYQITHYHSCCACLWNSQFSNISVLHLSLSSPSDPVVQMVWGLGTPVNAKWEKKESKSITFLPPRLLFFFTHTLSVFLSSALGLGKIKSSLNQLGKPSVKLMSWNAWMNQSGLLRGEIPASLCIWALIRPV